MAHKVVDGKIVLDPADTKPGSAGAEVLSAKLKILRDRKVFLDAHQLGPQVADELEKIVDALGGKRVMDVGAADLVIDNPMYPGYVGASESEPAGPPERRSYQFLAASLEAQEAVDPAKLPAPFMRTHWRAEGRHRPLMAYVSTNIARYRTMEEARVTRERVSEMLTRSGAIVVLKRAAADVLLVDRKSTFFNTKIVSEVRRHKRTWQRFAERQWADDSVAARHMLPLQDVDGNVLEGPGEGVDAAPVEGQSSAGADAQGPDQSPKKENATQPEPTTVNDATDSDDRARRRAAAQSEERRRQREDSFLEDDGMDATFKKGPGRPAGKPRVDYTPQDDEFLCRYLAHFHPEGAWSSRKTFELMLDREDRYPLIPRHPPQSWHERFKKNKAQFSRRVERLKLQGLDDELKTRDERAEAQRRAAVTRAGGGEPSGTATRTSPSSRKGKERVDDAGPSTAKHDEPTRDTAAPAKRKLVEADSDTEAPLLKRQLESSVSGRGGIGRQRFAPSGTNSARPGIIPSSRPVDLPLSTAPEVAAPAENVQEPERGERAEQPPQLVETAAEPAKEGQTTTEEDILVVNDVAETTAVDAAPSNPENTEPLPATAEEPPARVNEAAEAPAAPFNAPPDSPQAPPAPPTPETSTRQPRPSAVADLVERRRAPLTPVSARVRVRKRASIATVAHTRTLSDVSTASAKKRRVERDTVAVSPTIPPPRRVSTSSADTEAPAPPPAGQVAPQTPAPPITPDELRRRVEHGRTLVQDVGRTYQEHVRRWLTTFGVSQADIMAAVKEVRRTHDLRQGSAMFAEIERVLQQRHGV